MLAVGAMLRNTGLRVPRHRGCLSRLLASGSEDARPRRPRAEGSDGEQPPAAPSPAAAASRESCVVYLAPDVQRSREGVGMHAGGRYVFKRGRPAFVDHLRLRVSAGDGGAGACAFTRAPNMEVAPPDGGHGGNGGSVWLQADAAVSSLRMSLRHARAGHGAAGSGNLRAGRAGDDVVVRVPPGTVARVVDVPGLEGDVLCDLDHDGRRAQVARGGRGGRGNASFKSSTNRSPTCAQSGTPGESLIIDLELKSIADVGLVGFPNAGKSTLLRAISHAKPKVASYPFTTLRPHIGVVEESVARIERDPRRITVADIPGLIAGAHENRGLGHEFLRHIERTAVLVYVLDMSSAANAGRRELDVLMRELELYEPGLSKRPSCIAANKMDTGPDAVSGLRALIHEVGDTLPIFPISAHERTGTDDLVSHLFELGRSVHKEQDVGGSREEARAAEGRSLGAEVLQPQMVSA